MVASAVRHDKCSVYHDQDMRYNNKAYTYVYVCMHAYAKHTRTHVMHIMHTHMPLYVIYKQMFLFFFVPCASLKLLGVVTNATKAEQ